MTPVPARGSRRVWTVLAFFVCTLFAAILLSVPVSAQTPTPTPGNYGFYTGTYPGGYNPAGLYGCTSWGVSEDYSVSQYDDFNCDQLGTGLVEGQFLSDPVTVGGYYGTDSEGNGIHRTDYWLYIMPPYGTYTMTGGCDYLYDFSGSTSSRAASITQPSTSFFTKVGAISNATASQSFLWSLVRKNPINNSQSWEAQVDDIDTMRASVPGSISPVAGGAWRFSFNTTGVSRGYSGSMTCYVTGLFFQDGTPVESENPPTPTPTSTPEFAPWPTPVNWLITPLAPVSNTVEIGIGVPGTPECSVIVPGRAYTDTVFGYDLDIGWTNYEICTQPTDVDVELFGIDFGGYFLLAIGVLSVGVVFKLFRSGG